MDLNVSFADEISGGSLRRRQKSSEDEVVTLRCDPCLSELNSIEAEMFCEDCNQYLCETCIRFHKKFATTMSHTLVDKETMSEPTPKTHKEIFHVDHPIDPTLQQTTSQGKSQHGHRYENTALAHIGDVNVKTSTDKHDCNITGSELLTADFLVLADNHNNAIKILDTKHRMILAEHTMSSAPWDVTVVEEGLFEPEQFAVTLPKERAIQFLTLSDGVLSEGKRVHVDGDCRGIAYSHRRLAVTCDSPPPCKVEILDMEGRVIQTLSHDKNGKTLFKCPQNIAATPDGAYLYVTDRITCDVTKLTFDGKIVATYDDKALCSPEGIAVASDGTLIVCNYKNNMLHLVSSECERLKIVKPLSDDVLCPTAICYCEQRNRLYVSRYWVGAHPLYVNHIKIFEFELLPKLE